MSFNQKKTDIIITDDMNIKSHLDASLELDGIQVSEDLIQRTLAAIKKQEAAGGQEAAAIEEEKQVSEKQRLIPWRGYILKTASVAAAVILLVIGFNAVRLSGGMKFGKSTATESNNMAGSASEDSKITESQAMENDAAGVETQGTATLEATAPAYSMNKAAKADTTAPEQPAAANNEEGAANKADESAVASSASDSSEIKSKTDSNQNSFTSLLPSSGSTAEYNANQTQTQSDIAKEDEAEAKDTLGQEKYATTTQEPVLGTTKYGLESQMLKFTDFCTISQDEAETVSIMDASNNSVVLSDKLAITNFFLMIQQFSFSETSNGSASDLNYTVIIKSSNATDTVVLKDNVVSNSFTADNNTTSGTYNASNYETLVNDISELFTKNQK